jgi:DNA-directed RNA polymerase subunit RPC12/RpoP
MEPICSFCGRALTFRQMQPDHFAEYECAHCGAEALIQEVPFAADTPLGKWEGIAPEPEEFYDDDRHLYSDFEYGDAL